MDNTNNFQRSFLIFKQEDIGFGEDGDPTGYLKVEARDGKGKMTVSVQNLKEDNDGLNYKAYILVLEKDRVLPVCAGSIPMKKNKGELQWEFNPDNVAMTGKSIGEFNMAAVIVEYKNKRNLQVVCPLAAYKGQKSKWREKTAELVYPTINREVVIDEEILTKKDVFSKYNDVIESKASSVEYIPDISLFGIDEELEKKFAEVEMPQIGEVNFKEQSNNTGAIEAEQRGSDENTGNVTDENTFTEENLQEKGIPEINEYNNILNQQEIKKESTTQGGISNCAYKNSAFCNPQVGNSGFNPCLNCISRNIKKETNNQIKNDLAAKAEIANKPASANLDKLSKSLDKYFEKNNPFNSKRRDYRWWKINNPVYLNNILYQYNIRTPLLFNPLVMMAHYKYRHLIVGIFSDRMRHRECIVCGVPGVQGIDEKPFGDMCKWVQLEGAKPRYGAFGYWLVYMDAITGKFLNIG